MVNNNSLTVQEVFNSWIETKTKKVKLSTISNYYNILNKHFLSVFSKRFIDYIDEEEISDFIQQLQLSTKTRYDIATAINSMCKFAYEEQLTNKYHHIDRVKVDTEEIEIFTEQEIERLESYLYANLNCINVTLLLALYTGVRIGEACALKWENIDLSKGIIHIKKTLQRIKNYDESIHQKTVIIIDEPKSKKSIRDIPIPDFFIPALRQFKTKENCYLLTGNVKYIEPRTLQRQFEKVLNTARIEYKNFHVLRHTFATDCYNKGMSIKVLSELLGHSSVSFTEARYVHTNINIKRQDN